MPSCTLRLGRAAIETVLKGEQGLADRVGEGHTGVVDKGNVAHTPSLMMMRMMMMMMMMM
jgi:hypothetical protein